MTEKSISVEETKNPPAGESELPSVLPLLTIVNQVIFPLSVAPIRLTSKAETKLIDDAVVGSKMVAMLTVKKPDMEPTELETLHEIGTIGRVLQIQHLPENAVNAVVQAIKRFKILSIEQREPYMTVRVQQLDEPTGEAEKMAPLVTAVKMQMAKLIRLSPNIPDAASSIVESIEDAGFLADLIASNLNITVEEKQSILSTLDRQQRLERLTYLLAREIELLELSEKIQRDVKSTINQGQREFFLRQQLKAIKEELGEGDIKRPDIEDYAKKIESRGLTEEAKKEALRELNRLDQMNEASAEYSVITSYLDWLVELPWNEVTKDNLDIKSAERILNEDHYGLNKVKNRILEFLAVHKLKSDAHGPILCFVGPPGVGKTSLGKSIARALGRNFGRMSLGGMRDEAEIRGHRRTYVGAMPGRIIQSIRKAQSRNPLIMLDEIDKLGSDFRGDPSSALLEVLDPAQNDSFTDLYLSVPFDLSKVMFIATANVLDTIPWALRDRMEIIEIPGYTMEEKLQIASTYLVPRQLAAHGLSTKRLKFSTPVLRKIIAEYTAEAGVRNLEREIANVCRGTARAFASGRRKPIVVKPDDLKTYLGNEKVYHDTAERTRMPGVAVGMAWTATGGGILFIEATRMPGTGKLNLTGQLGDVMKESAQAAMSFLRANAGRIGLSDEAFSKSDFHIHVPAGAVPKDGPSAGVTMLTALTSLLTGKKVKADLAMTGEITLRGLVLPVGGVKEKVLAAVRAGIKTIVLPERCKNDLDEVPETAKKKVKFHFVTAMDEVLHIALDLPIGNGKQAPAPAPKTTRKRTKTT